MALISVKPKPPESRRDRLLTCVHEAGHMFYALALRNSVALDGPEIWFDTETGEYHGIDASVTVGWENFPEHAPDGIKVFIGGLVFREVLTDQPNVPKEYAKDVTQAEKWFNKYFGTGRSGFQPEMNTAYAEIREDLESLQFRRYIWGMAKTIEGAIFWNAGPDR